MNQRRKAREPSKFTVGCARGRFGIGAVITVIAVGGVILITFGFRQHAVDEELDNPYNKKLLLPQFRAAHLSITATTRLSFLDFMRRRVPSAALVCLEELFRLGIAENVNDLDGPGVRLTAVTAAINL